MLQKKPTAITTDGTNFVLGAKDGKLYSLPDTTGYAAATMWEIPCLDSQANTYRIHSVVPGNNNFIAIASNTAAGSQDSEVLIINKDGSGYRKATDNVTISELKPGLTFDVLAGTINNTASDYPVDVIVAVFDSNKTLKKVEVQRANIVPGISDIRIPVEVGADVDSTCTMKVLIWNTLEGMKPFTKVHEFFNTSM